MKLKCKINNEEFDLVQGATFSEEYNETLDSGSIIIDRVNKLDIEPFDYVIIYDTESNWKKTMLIGGYNAQPISLKSKKFTYTIDLVSETKGLEKIILPNCCYTRPLKIEKRLKLSEVVENYLNLYNIKRKYKFGSNYWTVKNKYSLGPTIKARLAEIECPEFAFNTPTLRELLNFLFMIVNSIPIVTNGVIEAIDISKTVGSFNLDKGIDNNEINYINYSKSGEGYANSLVKNYSNALSKKGVCKRTEYLGFRDINNYAIKLENLKLETSFPIYTVDKIIMCSWRTITIYNVKTNKDEVRNILVKHDISKLVKLEVDRNFLNPNYVYLPTPNKNNPEGSLDEIADYKMTTVGYNRGSKEISGWGFGYSYYDPESVMGTLGWIQTKKTLLENILNLMGYLYPWGTGSNVNTIQSKLNENEYVSDGQEPVDATSYVESFMIDPASGNVEPVEFLKTYLTSKMKSVFFKVEYTALTNSKAIVKKENVFKEICEMTDNQSSSLCLVEEEGKNALSKANRIGNEAVQINARYDDINKVQNVGTVFGDNYIVFKKQYSIYNKVIKVNYAATQNFVLQNYFNSVRAKNRNYNLLSYGESTVRSENFFTNVLLSKEKQYFDNHNNLKLLYYSPIKKDFSEVTIIKRDNIEFDIYDLLLSSFKESARKKNFFEDSYEPFSVNNYTMFFKNQNYIRDINIYCVGDNSICFATEMIDNASAGTYIEKFRPSYLADDNSWKLIEDVFSKDKTKELAGAIQKYYMTVDDNDTGIAQNIYFFPCNLKQENNIVTQYAEATTAEEMQNYFENCLIKKPRVNDDYEKIIFAFGNKDKSLWKQNAEALNITQQINYMTDTEDIGWSSNFLLTNLLYGKKTKIFESYYAVTGRYSIGTRASVFDVTSNVQLLAQHSLPVLVLDIPQDVFETLIKYEHTYNYKLECGYSWKGTDETHDNPDIYDKFVITINLNKIISYSLKEVTVQIYYYRRETNNDITYNQIEKEITFKRFGIGTEDIADNFLFANCVNKEGCLSYGWTPTNIKDLAIFGLSFETVGATKPKYLFMPKNSQQTVMWKTGDAQNKATFLEKECKDDEFNKLGFMQKNSFVFTSQEKVDFKTLKDKNFTLDELTKKGFAIQDNRVDDIFMIGTTENERPGIFIKKISDEKSTMFFFLEDGYYQFVFGNNFSNKVKEKNITTSLSNPFLVITKFTDWLWSTEDYQMTTSFSLSKDNKLSTQPVTIKNLKVIHFGKGEKYKFVVKRDFVDGIDRFDRAFYDEKNTVIRLTNSYNTSKKVDIPFFSQMIEADDRITIYYTPNEDFDAYINILLTPEMAAKENMGLNFVFMIQKDNYTSEATWEKMESLDMNEPLQIKTNLSEKREMISISVMDENMDISVYSTENLRIAKNKNWIDDFDALFDAEYEDL